MKLLTALSPFLLPETNSFQPNLSPQRSLTCLSYYKPNLPLSSRLSEIKSELTNIQKGGLDKFLLDEISAAQKRLNLDASNAEKYADAIVKKGRGEEGKLMRETLRNEDDMAAVLNGLKGVRQELEEVRGVKELSGVVEETVKNDLLLENDLLSVTTKVASSLKDAEATIQSSVATLLSGDMSGDDKEKMLKQLETVLKSINQSLQTSNTLAISAKKSIDESFVILSRITQTRNELMDAMEDTEDTIGFIAERGSEDKSLMEVVNGMGDVAYETIKEVESTEKLANAITTKVSKEADTVLSLNTKTTEVVSENIKSVINAIRESKSSDNTKVLTEYATKLKQQGEYINQYTNAIQSDITSDKSALELIRNANTKLQTLLDAAENQVDAAKRAILTGDKIDPSYIEQNIVDVKSAIFAIIDATKASAESSMNKIKSSNVVEKVKVEENAKSGAEKVANAPAAKAEATKPEQSSDIKPDAKPDKPEQKVEDAPNRPVESTVETEAIESKTIGDKSTKPEKEKVEPKEGEKPIKSEQTSDAKPSDMKGHDESSNPNTADPQEGGASNPDMSKETKSSTGASKQASEETSKDRESVDHQSNQKGDDVKSETKVENTAGGSNASKNGDDKLVSNEKETSIIPDTSSATGSESQSSIGIDSKSTITLAETPAAESHSGAVVNTHIDISDLHASTPEIGHELAAAASNAVEVVHDLANAIATSFFL